MRLEHLLSGVVLLGVCIATDADTLDLQERGRCFLRLLKRMVTGKTDHCLRAVIRYLVAKEIERVSGPGL